MRANGVETLDIPAFLRRQGPDVEAAEATPNPFGPANPNLEQLVISIAGHLEGGAGVVGLVKAALAK